MHIAVFASKNNLQAITKSLEQISVSSLDLLFLDELTEDCAPNNSLAKEIIFTTDLTLGQEKKLHCFFALLENTTELPQETNKIFYSKEISSVFPYLLKYQQVSQATLSEQLYTTPHQTTTARKNFISSKDRFINNRNYQRAYSYAAHRLQKSNFIP